MGCKFYFPFKIGLVLNNVKYLYLNTEPPGRAVRLINSLHTIFI